MLAGRTPPPRRRQSRSRSRRRCAKSPELLGLEARARAAVKGAASPQRHTSSSSSVAFCTTREWPDAQALARFSTGIGQGQTCQGCEEPEIRAGWFKSPVDSVTMEQLNRCQDMGCFFALPLDHTSWWKECHVYFRRGGFRHSPLVSISAGQISALQNSGRVALHFPGLRPTSLKLLFRSPGSCCTMLSESPAAHGLQFACVQPQRGSLPVGFSLTLQPKAWNELSGGERLSKVYFQSMLLPSLGPLHDEAAARLETLLEGLSVGQQRFLRRGSGAAAFFDLRPGAEILSLRFRGVARSASAPRFLELLQAPPGEVPQVKHVLLKHGDNPHQDRFALAMARVFNYVWEREGVAVSVAGQAELVQNVLYGVSQAGVRTSVIEVIAGSSPVRSFHDRHSKVMLAMFGDGWWQGDLNDWVPSAALLASAAAAFTSAYVLEVGDRHQDNMLVTRDGRLFNIDFGYIFGEQPRFVDAKPFAIPVAFRAALVQNGPLWGIFKAACVRAFAALVKHREFVMLQAIETARLLGSHFLLTHALTFGDRLAPPPELQRPVSNSFDGSGPALDAFAAAVGPALCKKIERGVYGHQAKDALHERSCSVM